MTIDANTAKADDGKTLITPFSKIVRAAVTKEEKKEKKAEPYEFDKASETLEIAEGAVQWQILQK
jgi:hypothetical protein